MCRQPRDQPTRDRSRIAGFSAASLVSRPVSILRVFLVVFAIALTLKVKYAFAQTASDRETARLLMDRGDELLEKGSAEEALTYYLGAHEIMHVPTTGIEVARTYARLDKLVEARDAALEVLRMPVVSEEPTPFKVARAAAEQLAHDLVEQIPLLRIEIAPPAAAEHALLNVDGRKVPSAALNLPLSLNPKEHIVQVAAAGFVAFEQRVVLARGEHRSLSVVLASLGASAKQNEPSDLNQTQTVPSKPRTIPTNDDASQTQRRPGWPVWLGVGVGGTGLVVGAIAGVVSLERTKSAKAKCSGNQCPADAKSDRDAAITAANVSNVGFAVSALGAAVSVTSWWLSGRSPHPNATALGIAALRSGGMLEVSGSLW